MEEINTTPMNVLSPDSSWLFDLEMVDEYNLFDEEDKFLSHDIDCAVSLEEQTQTMQQCLTKECISSTLSKEETGFDRCFELGNIAQNFSQKYYASSSSSSFQILSFDNPNPTQFYGLSASLPELGNTNFSTRTAKSSSKKSKAKRSLDQVQDNVKAERKRREKLTQCFIALAALLPNLMKMDKTSILEDTIKCIKELKERLAILEEEGKKSKEGQSMVVSNKPDLCCETESVVDGTASESPINVEAKVSGKHILIRIQCQNHNGFLVKIVTEIQNYQLFVVNNNVMALGDSIVDITIIAEIGEGYNLTIKELVQNLRMAALKFMSSN